LFLLIFFTSATAQQRVIDSLQRIVALQHHDSTELEALLNLTNEFLRKDFNKSLVYARQAVCLAKLNYDVLRLNRGYHYLVALSQGYSKLDSAGYYLGLMEKLVSENPDNVKLRTNYNQSAGLFYKNQGEYKKALPYLLANLSQMKKEDESKAGSLLNIGNTYNQMGDYSTAMMYHLKSLALFEKIGNKRGQSFCLHSLGNDYYSLKQIGKAQEYFQRSLEMKTTLQDKRGMINAWQGLGNVAKDQNQHAQAEGYYKKSLEIARALKLVGDEIITLNQLGLTYIRKGDPEEARKVFTTALKLARIHGDSSISARLKSALIGLDLEDQKVKQTEVTLINNLNTFILSGDKNGLVIEYGRLSEYYAINKNYDKALEYLKKYEALKDSLEGNAVLLQMKTLEEQYKSDKKEKEIELLKKDQELHKLELSRQQANTSIIVIALISVIIISILLINRYRVLNRTRRLVEMERMRNTIARDLHDDIGSTLSSINIISQMALKEANGSASHFQRIAQHSSSMMESMSDIVWSINPNNDSLEQVVSKMKEFTAEILDPLDINYTFSGEDDLHAIKLDVSTRKNLFLIFKEAINNAAKYSSAKAINIIFKKENGSLSLNIQDNGRGFDVQGNSSGNGLRNMKERAENLHGKLDLKSSLDGTEIVLSVPLT
jgi:signal transduction histidine kinase